MLRFFDFFINCLNSLSQAINPCFKPLYFLGNGVLKGLKILRIAVDPYAVTLDDACGYADGC